MTTRVIVMNAGSQPDKVVHVHTEGRDEHGHFQRSDTRILTNGEFAELHVHDGMQLAVHEHAKE